MLLVTIPCMALALLANSYNSFASFYFYPHHCDILHNVRHEGHNLIFSQWVEQLLFQRQINYCSGDLILVPVYIYLTLLTSCFLETDIWFYAKQMRFFFHQRCAWWRFHAWLCQFCSILLTFLRFCVYFGFLITVTYWTMWNTKVIILYVPSELSNCGANPWWTTVPATWSSVLSTYIVLYWQLFSWKLIFLIILIFIILIINSMM